jgi:hypothetical protein
MEDNIQLRKLAEAVTLTACIEKMFGSILDQVADYTDRGFSLVYFSLFRQIPG